MTTKIISRMRDATRGEMGKARLAYIMAKQRKRIFNQNVYSGQWFRTSGQSFLVRDGKITRQHKFKIRMARCE